MNVSNSTLQPAWCMIEKTRRKRRKKILKTAQIQKRHLAFFLFFFFFSPRTLPLSSFSTSRGHRCRSFPPPRFLRSIFNAHRIQQSHFSSIFHRVLLNHALAFSASQCVHKKKSPRIYARAHSAGLELPKLTYTRLEDNLIRHRGDRLVSTQLWHTKEPIGRVMGNMTFKNIHVRHRSAQQTQHTLGTCTEEKESSTSSSNTQQQRRRRRPRVQRRTIAQQRNCGAAAVVSTAAAIRQEEEHTQH